MRQKTKDNLIYLGVGLTIAAAFIFYMFYSERTTGTIQAIPRPILWAILSTPGVVAVILDRFWEFRRRPSLWIVCIVAASINVSVILVLHSFGWSPPVIVWSAMTVLWLTLVLIVAQKFVTPNGSR